MSIKNKLSRRDFIKITAVAGSVLAGGKLLFDLAKDDLVTVSETRLLMGTIINLAVIAESKSAGEAAVAATFKHLEHQVAIFSLRDPASPVAVLNRASKLANPPRELVEVLTKAVEISEMSDGAFDVTVKPLIDIYQQSLPGLPTAGAVNDVLHLVDHRNLNISKEEIAFSQPGMSITLDGIAKGYIVDAGTAVLKDFGFRNVYVEAGGDLMASGKKKGDILWKVGIQSPRNGHPGLLTQISVSNQAIATSGDYFQYFSADMLNHHIIDPRVGYSSPELASATIMSKSVMLSDALATTVMVLGVDQGITLLESLSGVEGYLVAKSLAAYQTEGFESKTS